MKLLVLVEDASVRRLIHNIVSNLTDKIWDFESPQDIPEALHKLKPDFVLVDIDAQRVKGVSALTQSRNLFPAARIVAITGYDYPDLTESIRKAGADACIPKENLLQLVRLLRWPGPKL